MQRRLQTPPRSVGCGTIAKCDRCIGKCGLSRHRASSPCLFRQTYRWEVQVMTNGCLTNGCHAWIIIGEKYFLRFLKSVYSPLRKLEQP